MWPDGLFIMLDALVDAIIRVWKKLKPEKKQLKQHWREMDYYYLEALNELNTMCPTGTEEEKGLARYLEFNDREDHERRQERKDRAGDRLTDTLRTGGTVSGGFTTLLAPGLGNALGGSLGGLGGSIGGLQGSLDQLGLGQQQQQLAANYYALQQQRSMMQPFSAHNDINPLADLSQALRESKKLDS